MMGPVPHTVILQSRVLRVGIQEVEISELEVSKGGRGKIPEP